MIRHWRRTVRTVLILCVPLILFPGVRADAVTHILKGANVEASPEAVQAIVEAFDQAEEALHTEKLEAIMVFYSEDYRNWGLRKIDTAQIWKDIFERYDQLTSRHVFSQIVVNTEKSIAQVTCTGALFGAPLLGRKGRPFPTGLTEQQMMIDSWFEAVHYLVREDQSWKIIGHDPAGGEKGPLGASIHLLF